MSIGEKIRYFRKESGYTQKELAELSGIATITLQQYELEKRVPVLDNLQKISDALKISLLDLVGNNEYKKVIRHQAQKEMERMLSDGTARMVSQDEQLLVSDYLKLNNTGKAEARKRVSELTEIPRYTEKDS